MANEEEKAIEKDREAIKPSEGKQDDLSEKDLGKAVGGAVNAYIYIDGIQGPSKD